ncbi:keratin, type I cytoskeletal 18-like [Narcine bancroftii]|uniref:keratin, type I cytoskeletal 18-like n=1 Tax=Narcine bancroftii TaxID=1343680 RepID=UPI0038313A21
MEKFGTKLSRGNSLSIRTPSFSSLVISGSQRRPSSSRSLQGDLANKPVRLLSHGPVAVPCRIGLSLSSLNQQDELQGLNKRLAGFLNKVRTLESANKELENKIKVLVARKGSLSRDWQSYEKPVIDICKQVQDTNMDNAGLTLQLDNCELASDDFKVKWQSEMDLRHSVEQDLNGLRKILEDTNLGHGQLEAQIETMNEELGYLRKNHQEEVDDLKKQISDSNISVELESSEEEDLGKVINKIREEYQALADYNKKEAEECYRKKFDAASLEVSKNNEALQTVKQNVIETRRQIKTLEAEHRMLGATINSLEDSLQDTEDRIALELQNLNHTIANLEQQLAKLRTDLKNRGMEYEALLNTKMRLQAEIDTYRKLLEGDGLDGCQRLQSDIDRMQSWAETWQMEFNPGKCKVVHVRMSNLKIESNVNGKMLSSVDGLRDLEVCVHRALNAAAQVNSDVNKDMDIMERAQRFTQLLLGLENMSSEERLSELGLFSMERWKARGDRIEVYRMMRGIDHMVSMFSLERVARLVQRSGLGFESRAVSHLDYRSIEVSWHWTENETQLPCDQSQTRKNAKKIIIISQKLVDGKVVSEKQESENILD